MTENIPKRMSFGKLASTQNRHERSRLSRINGLIRNPHNPKLNFIAFLLTNFAKAPFSSQVFREMSRMLQFSKYKHRKEKFANESNVKKVCITFNQKS